MDEFDLWLNTLLHIVPFLKMFG